MSRQGQVKNRAPAPIQISAEQIIREAADRQEAHVLDPVSKIHDAEEYQSFLSSRRKHFEDNIRYRREHIGNWVKYANFEEENKEYERSRSVFERALEVEHRSGELWLRYALFEMRNEFVNRARNILDRAVQILPRIDNLWYKYAYMEEMVGDVDKCREVFERWMGWYPDEGAWLSYARFEVRCAKDEAIRNGKQPNAADMERATEVMKRYVNEYPCAKSFLKLGKWAEHEARDIGLARKVYESALMELEPEEARQARVFRQFATFEERQGEYERARVIYRHAIKLLHLEERHPLSISSSKQQDQDAPAVIDEDITDNERYRRDELYKAYVAFEKKHGDKDGIENVILTKQRAEYNKKVANDPLEYDAWFEFAKLEEDHGEASTVRDVYERAVANIPPMQEKQYWKRYIYLWIYYALYEELEMKDLDRASEVYQTCLDIIPHSKFSFAKVWIYAAKLHVRRRDLTSARKLLGNAIGLCGKEKIFVEYIGLELTLGEVDRCRALYNNYLKAMPHNCKAWSRYADLERSVGETERCRALYELAVSQEALDMPELLWKGFIDFEIEEGEGDNARKLYERLLERTGHVKVWISYGQFEATGIGHGTKEARNIFERAYQCLKEEGLKEERVLLLDAWRVFEKSNGDGSSVAAVEAKMPRRIKRKRMQTDEGTGAELGWEEYFDYHFPDDQDAASNNLKILEMAAKWKQNAAALSEEDSDEDSE
jgi:crooked neck